ncbi:MAG: beta-galactosidase trimerization domain-containing protein [Phycisphaeraceae bacterium]|nr:beta-galactosidase trimerization domain-containing protein [Phycisphaeraceae bacterium]
MQRKLRSLAPIPVGVVLIEWPGMTEQEIRGHFRTMKELGYTCLKQFLPLEDGHGFRKMAHWALDEGIIPFWYAEGAYEEITPELLKRLGLPSTMSSDEAIEHPTMVEYQTKLMRKRVDRHADAYEAQLQQKIRSEPRTGSGRVVPGVNPQINGTELKPETVPHFVAWLKEQYGTVEALKEAWNCHILAGTVNIRWKTWDDVEREVTEFPDREYRHLRDILAFKAHTFIEEVFRPRVAERDKVDPDEPLRAGGEMGLFLPFASRGTDMELIALTMAEGGSFYPSLHPAWHFEEVGFEFARTVYMQASISADWARGIWSATWESTGGPQYFSGGKAPFVPDARNQMPGVTIDAGALRQMMFSYMAAGYRGFGMWAWNPRLAGWEAGEFALTDRNLKPTRRAVEAGKVGMAARRLRRDLWESDKEPLVGVLVDWDSEATWAAMSVTGRYFFKNEPIRARSGAARALINHNVPWEHVTTRQLAQGAWARYPVIYLPSIIAPSRSLLENLKTFVERGGRLVIDTPSAYYDEFGRLTPTGEGSLFEQIFGVVLHEHGFANNVPYVVGEVLCEGLIGMVSTTRAKVCAEFEVGLPAITEADLGRGRALLMAYEAGRNCFQTGNTAAEALLVKTLLGDLESPYACDQAIVYRLVGPSADHYFLINDGPAVEAELRIGDRGYRSCEDAVEQVPVDLARIGLEAYDGRWIRCAK